MARCVRETVAQREWMAGQLISRGYPVAPSATNFLFMNLGRPNAPVAEALLQRGVIVKPWKERGYETFIRVSIGTPADNQQFMAALDAAMQAPALV
jgi:histidinol-phosphate aminotransferase